MTEYKFVKQEGLIAIYEPIKEIVEEPVITEIEKLARQLHDLFYESEMWPYDFDSIHPNEKTAWIMVAQYVDSRGNSE